MHETHDAKMMFVPDRVEVKRGEQVKFVLRNVGKVEHEFMLDSDREQRQAQDCDGEEPGHGARRPERETPHARGVVRDRLALHEGWHLRVRLP